jgi:hypothetical protein
MMDNNKIHPDTPMKPGVCIPWEEKRKELPEQIPGDEKIVEDVWKNIDSLAHTYIWHCLVSF